MLKKGVDIYYEVYGKGAPVILLHGGFGNGTYWRNQIPILAATYQVIVRDEGGHAQLSEENQRDHQREAIRAPAPARFPSADSPPATMAAATA